MGTTWPSTSAATRAAAAASRRLGCCGDDVVVVMSGGALQVRIDDEFNVIQVGPVAFVAAGDLAAELFGDGA